MKKYREAVLKELKPSNRDIRDQQLTWWDERFTGKTLAEITSDVIALARDELAAGTFTREKERKSKKTGEVVAPKTYERSGATVNRYMAALSHPYTIALKA